MIIVMYSFLREEGEGLRPLLCCGLNLGLDREHHVAFVADLEVVAAALAVRPGAGACLVLGLAVCADREDFVRGR